MPAPPRDPDDFSGQPDEADGEAPDSAPVSSRAAVAVVPVAEPAPESGPRLSVKEALQRFVLSSRKGEGLDFIEAVIIRKLWGPTPRKDAIQHDLVDDIASRAQARAHFAKSPPWTVRGIPGWVRRLTRREIADYFEEGKEDREYLDASADAYQWTDRHAPATDERARARWIHEWLEEQIGDSPEKVNTMELMKLHEIDGWSLEELAKKRGTSADAIRKRIARLRAELQPKARLMDREKPRLAILFFLWGALAAFFVVVALVVFRWVSPPPQPVPPPPRPAPSASASAGPPAPSFDQAQPPRNEDQPAPTFKPGGK